jgi:hypothetical protein
MRLEALGIVPRILYLAMDERLPLELLGDIADLLLLLLVQPDAPPQNWSLIASVLASTLSPQWLRQPQRPRVSVLDPINVRSGFWHIDTQRWSSRPAVVIRNVLIEVVTAVGCARWQCPTFLPSRASARARAGSHSDCEGALLGRKTVRRVPARIPVQVVVHVCESEEPPKFGHTVPKADVSTL